MESLEELQNVVLEYCKDKISEVAFTCWLKDIKLKSFVDNSAVISVPNKFKKQIVSQNYINILSDAFEQIFSFKVNISIVCDEDTVSVNTDSDRTHNDVGYEYNFDTFIIGNSNRYAHAASLTVAENPAKIYNPLFIYGQSGLGKTHLLNAIATRIKEKFPDMTIVSESCETFVNEFIAAVPKGGYGSGGDVKINAFREKYRNADVLLIDDIQFIGGKDSSEEEFFNTFEALYKEKKQIVITSDRPPKNIKTLTDRLLSRIEASLIVDIQPPEFETRVAILKRKEELLNIDVPDDVNFFIAEQVKKNIRQLEGIVKKLQAILNMQEKITKASAQLAIKDIQDAPKPITVKRVVEEVARTYNVSVEDICSKKRTSDIKNARQISIYIIKQVIDMPYEKIGAEFQMTHSTAIHSYDKVKELIDKDERENNIIKDIISNLQNEV